jgi:RNA polymerase sigma-70 factor (ECF subfamily)
MTTASPRSSRVETAKARGPSLVRLPLCDTDAEMVAAIRAGQRVGGAALYDRYHAHVRRVLIRVFGPDIELGDLIQDVFVEAIDSIDRLEQPEALRGWLASIAVFLARGEIRRRARSRWFPLFSNEHLPEVPAPVSTPEVDEALRATYRVLEKLSADERIVFALRFVDGMQIAEVADVCRISSATVKRRLVRAQKRFLAIARNVPEISDWLSGGTRWT